MWWSRIFAALLAVCFLAACGFQPLYGGGKRGPAAAELASIRIEPIADRSGQILRNHLLDRLNPYGRPANPAYVLQINLVDSLTGVAVRKSEFPTRTSLRISASYNLARADTGQSVFSASSAIEGGYNILTSEYATWPPSRCPRAACARGRHRNGPGSPLFSAATGTAGGPAGAVRSPATARMPLSGGGPQDRRRPHLRAGSRPGLGAGREPGPLRR